MTHSPDVCVLDAPTALLGESPRWDAARQVVRWVDLWGGLIHTTDLRGGTTSRPTGIPTSSVVLAQGRLLATVGSALCDVPADGPVTPLLSGLGPDGGRCNDSAVDPRGRLWIGTMGWTADDHRTGDLLRIGPGGRVSRVLTGTGLANGMAWNAAGDTMWFVDTRARTLTAYEYDPDDGHLGAPRTVIHVPVGDGAPDGIAIDADDAVWVALHGRGLVRRYAADGRVLQEVGLPAATVTACAFVGADRGQLVVTSGRRGLTASDLAAMPLAGSLFILDVAVGGPALPLVDLETVLSPPEVDHE